MSHDAPTTTLGVLLSDGNYAFGEYMADVRRLCTMRGSRTSTTPHDAREALTSHECLPCVNAAIQVPPPPPKDFEAKELEGSMRRREAIRLMVSLPPSVERCMLGSRDADWALVPSGKRQSSGISTLVLSVTASWRRADVRLLGYRTGYNLKTWIQRAVAT